MDIKVTIRLRTELDDRYQFRHKVFFFFGSTTGRCYLSFMVQSIIATRNQVGRTTAKVHLGPLGQGRGQSPASPNERGVNQRWSNLDTETN